VSPLDLGSASLATALRLGRGVVTRPAARKPDEPLRLYEFEACPFCRKVRDALTELDLDALILPCPRGGAVYRAEAEAEGVGSFPYLEDPNTGATMVESEAILDYLYGTYGERPRPVFDRLLKLNLVSSLFASAVRPHRGRVARPTRARPAEPLELWSFEASPFSRVVRDTLCELELPYLLHSAGRASVAEHVPVQLRHRLGYTPTPSTASRRELQARAGRLQVPFLVDPNTEVELLESDAIVAYLEDTYAARPRATAASSG
jgi:glutathione S-transferase